MKDLNQADWKAQIEANENAVILDVRRPDECEEGIIPNAITLDIMNPQPFLKEVEKLDKNVPYFIYCRSGARSGQACLIMERSEEHTSELQSRPHLVCRLLLEKKKDIGGSVIRSHIMKD